MLETEVEPDAWPKPGPDGLVHLLGGRPPEPLTPEQLERIAQMDEFFAEKQRRWDAMTPAEQAAEEAAWEQVMRNINDRQRRSRGIVGDATDTP